MAAVAPSQPRWHLRDSVLEIREGETLDAQAELVELYEDQWEGLGFQVSQPLGGDRDTWRIRTDGWAGVAQLPRRDAYAPQLQIRPKLDLDLFFLADYAFGRERNRIAQQRLEAHVDALRETPTAHLIAWFLAELESFILRHLRRDYIVQHEVFEARIRGRLLVSEYLQRYVTSGQSHRAPCQFFEFTRDNLANQILKRSLRELRRLATLLPLPSARRELCDWADRLLPFVGAVSDRPIHPADFNRLRLRGSMRHYAPIIDKCRALLTQTYMTTELGAHRQDAFLWSTSDLFERALHGILKTTRGIKLMPRGAKAEIVSPEGAIVRRTRVLPDYVLRILGSRLILDAKYKDTRLLAEASDEILELEVLGRRSIRVHRSDIYQVIAYAQHARYGPAAVALVYPVVLQRGQQLPAPYRVTGFGNDVQLFFLDVGRQALDNLEAFARSSFSLPVTRTSRLSPSRQAGLCRQAERCVSKCG
jgi:5-methylcytosine-specific restriction enzyme subunit McrC